MDKSIISARGLGCQSGDQYLIKDIRWEIAEKSRWIVLGTNGSGKTTLLSILAGYQDYTHGELFFKGKSYRAHDIIEIRKKMGWISNSYFDRIYQEESICDILLAGLSGTLGVEEPVITLGQLRKVKRLLAQVGLSEKLDFSYCWLSKGERQNILILRALLAQPEILVLDEPMTGLDVISRHTMMRFVQQLAVEQTHTMLYVTHHFEEISPELFDGCILMRHGQIYRSGAIKDIICSEIISEFLRRPVQVEQMQNGYYQLNFNS